jgi:hypothetical protein
LDSSAASGKNDDDADDDDADDDDSTDHERKGTRQGSVLCGVI